jgi:hypothetical protein
LTCSKNHGVYEKFEDTEMFVRKCKFRTDHAIIKRNGTKQKQAIVPKTLHRK